MDHIFNLIEKHSTNSRIKVPITESTMMQIVQSALDKAYRKVKSNSGVLERLTEISKFYELSVMQLEGCLKFVREETDNYVLESCHKLLLEDLTEIKDRLRGRLREVELAISEKDKELLESLGNEMKLRKALEMSEKELEKRKSEGIEELLLVTQATTDGDREGEICELMNSVDQQVWHIQKQLEPNHELRDEDRNQGIDNKKIEQMGSDLSSLKETLDLAFIKMQNAIFLSELAPIEHQWMWNIERVTSATVIKGFLKDFQENSAKQVKKIEIQVSVGLRKHLSDVLKEMTSLSHELELLSDQGEVQVKSLKPKRRCLSEGNSFNNSNNFSLKVEEANTTGQPSKEDSKDDGEHHVAKMIKNHESIIRRKSEELNSLKREILQEKRYPSFRRSEKISVNTKRRIQEVIVSLESLVNCNGGIGNSFGDLRYDCDEVEKPLDGRLLAADDQIDIEKSSGNKSMEEVWEKVKKTSVSQRGNEEKCAEIRMLKQEMEDANLQTMIREKTYLTLFKSLADEFHFEMLNYRSQGQTKEGMDETFIEEMNNEWNQKTRSDRIELHCLENRNFSSLGNMEGMLKKDVYTFLLEEILREWNENIESSKYKCSLGEELCFIVFGETARDIMNSASYALTKLQEIGVHDKFFENAAILIKDDVWKVSLSEMVKEWQMKIDAFHTESLIREESVQEADDQNQETCSNEKESLRETLDRLVKFLQEQEALILSACSELKEHKMRLHLVGSVSDELDGHEYFQVLCTNEQNSIKSTSSKLETALQQLDIGKAILRELGPQLGITVGNLELCRDEMTPLIATTSFRDSSICQSKDVEDLKAQVYESLFTPIQELSQTLKGFQCSSCTTLGRHVLRLEEMKHQLDLVVQLTASLSQQEALYRKAFIRRCENLQMAESEVDLLGDQVDILLGLLEKVYVTLRRHSPVLLQHSEVTEMLKLIEKEIGGKR